MCSMCDGATFDEALDDQVALTAEHGWSMVHVTGEFAWTYTIGLTWNYELPELIVVGWPAAQAGSLLHDVLDSVVARARGPASGSSIALADRPVDFSGVHPDNLESEWFALWPDVARASDRFTVELSALQVSTPCNATCPEPHDFVDRVLEQPIDPADAARRRRNLIHLRGRRRPRDGTYRPSRR